MKIIIPKGIRIGHEQNEYTGVTVFLSEKGCVAGADVRGGAPGTRETDLLRTEKTVEKVNAVVLSGGSAYGLAATCGVMDYCREKGVGYTVGKKIVPIVCGAVIYDLNDRDYHYPTAEDGYKACLNAQNTPTFGQVGAGKGATVGKLRGIKYACKSGVGAYTVKSLGITVTAVICVNAFGDVVAEDGSVLAGAKSNSGTFINTEECLIHGDLKKIVLGKNTTIGCILTNAALDKRGANKLASAAHNGLARSIRPVHTEYDGDTLFCMATGKVPVLNFAALQSAAVVAVEKAVRNAVLSGKGTEIVCEEEEEE